MTRRERAEARLERRRTWAASRTAKAATLFDKADLREEKSGIPFGQPILVGHHSEGRHRRAIERADNAMRKAVECHDMAKHHAEKADGIEDMLETTIFSDDTDAIEALEARIAGLEAERERIKAYNASARKAAKTGARFGDLNILTEDDKKDLMACALCWIRDPENAVGIRFPSYKLSNLGGNIKRNRDRLAQIKRQHERAEAAESAPGGVVIVGRDFVNVTFAEKPEREILTALKGAGFRWRGGSWCGYRERLPVAVLEMVAA